MEHNVQIEQANDGRRLVSVMFACLDTLHGMWNYSSCIQRYSDVDPSEFYCILHTECKNTLITGVSMNVSLVIMPSVRININTSINKYIYNL